MASERLQSAQDLLDLTFQSLAMQHMDLKQVELDTAVAKVDELSRQLESLWTDGPGPPPQGHSRPEPLPPGPQEPGDPRGAGGRTGSPRLSPGPPLPAGGGSGPFPPAQGAGSARGGPSPVPAAPPSPL